MESRRYAPETVPSTQSARVIAASGVSTIRELYLSILQGDAGHQDELYESDSSEPPRRRDERYEPDPVRFTPPAHAIAVGGVIAIGKVPADPLTWPREAGPQEEVAFKALPTTSERETNVSVPADGELSVNADGELSVAQKMLLKFRYCTLGLPPPTLDGDQPGWIISADEVETVKIQRLPDSMEMRGGRRSLYGGLALASIMIAKGLKINDSSGPRPVEEVLGSEAPARAADGVIIAYEMLKSESSRVMESLPWFNSVRKHEPGPA